MRRTKDQILTDKLNAHLSKKSQDIGEAIQHIEKTGQMLSDHLVPIREMTFRNDDLLGVRLEYDAGENISIDLHRNAVQQFAGRMGVNGKDLVREYSGTGWERDAFTDRMNKYVQNIDERNLLVRVVDGKAKGILSDRYRRLNTALIFMQFLQAARDSGSVLVDANHGELSDFMEVIHPQLVEIPTKKNGVIHTVFGAQVSNSDFGARKLQLRIYQMNVVCLNGMVSKAMISDVHLGSKMDAVGNVTFTEETMNADTHARALAVRDIMKSLYSEENLTRERQRIVDATEVEIDFVSKVKELPKLGVRQGELELLNKTLMESKPSTGVTGDNTLWKMAQGLTYVANKAEDGDRKRELQDIASEMLTQTVG